MREGGDGRIFSLEFFKLSLSNCDITIKVLLHKALHVRSGCKSLLRFTRFSMAICVCPLCNKPNLARHLLAHGSNPVREVACSCPAGFLCAS
jgi:hypothetical protein